MTNQNFEGHSDGDWEERSYISWGELDWQQFLQRQEQEMGRFLRLYDSAVVPDVERLDWIASQMGWDAGDWSVSDSFDDDDVTSEAWKASDANQRPDTDDTDPYTVHCHPVFVVCSGLLLQVRHIWRTCLERQQPEVSPLTLWDFAQSLHETERQALIAMQCMDMGDFLLCVVHFKRALLAVNVAMKMLAQLSSNSSHAATVAPDLLKRLFDIREVCIRVISDCRLEENRD